MPRLISIDDEQFVRAVSELEDPILTQLAARPLSSVELTAQYTKKSFREGWRFEGVIGGKKTTLNLLLPFDFPYAPPSFGLVPPPTILTYPHIEEDGTLCLLFDGALVDPAQPVEVVKQLLSDAVGLLEKSYAGENHEDFRDEFLSYWGRVDTPSAKHFRSLLDPIGPSRIIRVWHGASSYTFAEDEKALIKWLGNLGDKKQFATYPAGLIWLKRPMLPDQYPKRNAGVLEAVRALGDENALRVLRSLAVAAEDGFDLLIGARASTGICFAGVSVSKPKGSSSPYSKEGSPLTKGFRPGHVPKDILATRYLNAAEPVTRHEVERADHAWIHGRDVDAGQFSLASKRVVIIGCGSIGSLVAKTLATAGVGTTTFIDHQKLGWPNTGRHFLGAKYVGIDKAKGMSDELQMNFPHLRFDHRVGNGRCICIGVIIDRR
ncbi:E2/UBC family protein [Leptolyngbya sp. 7M]|uniref:E2/UBC family protein n=1 Tax=Leptolyngbya sp. 7M TaxID=2812896 RepID=UPI001B8C3460|nr:E2/UBC family protein [Leptolyngbya sp. 7M]QYO66820.1 ThiF family adenylyltransferase [Leptolyngbya sp. 7M]